jgi:hypothetical protein
LLPLFAWGTIASEQEYGNFLYNEQGNVEFPAEPGVMALSFPYEGMVIALDPRCPARYVNDAKGVPNAEPNVVFEMNPHPNELLDGSKGLQMLVQAKTTKQIKEGEQLFCDYGEKFWTSNGPKLIGGSAQNQEEDYYFSDEAEDDKEEVERKEQAPKTAERKGTKSTEKKKEDNNKNKDKPVVKPKNKTPNRSTVTQPDPKHEREVDDIASDSDVPLVTMHTKKKKEEIDSEDTEVEKKTKRTPPPKKPATIKRKASRPRATSPVGRYDQASDEEDDSSLTPANLKYSYFVFIFFFFGFFSISKRKQKQQQN